MLKGALKNYVEWTQEEKDIVKAMFGSSTYAEMSHLLGRSESSIRHAANRMGLKKPPTPFNPYLKYNYNRDYFSNIETDEQAYWAGFIAADGNIYIKTDRTDHKGGDNCYVSIEISIKDIEHLRLFNKMLNGNISITTRQRKNTYINNREIKQSECAQIRLYSSQIVYDLINIGIIPNKTYNHKNLFIFDDEKLNISFLRGYYDGNGYFCTDTRGNGKKNGHFGISSPNLKYLETWRIRLYKLYGITSYIHEDGKYNKEKHPEAAIPCYKLIFRGLVNSYNFGQLLYQDALVYLPRKFNKYQRYLFENNVRDRVEHVLTYKSKMLTSNIASLVSNS